MGFCLLVCFVFKNNVYNVSMRSNVIFCIYMIILEKNVLNLFNTIEQNGKSMYIYIYIYGPGRRRPGWKGRRCCCRFCCRCMLFCDYGYIYIYIHVYNISFIYTYTYILYSCLETCSLLQK